MDKQAAVHAFWSGFGLVAYDENTVPDDAVIRNNGKYLTYNVATASFNEPIPLSAKLWYESTTWEDIAAKADQIEHAIGRGGRVVPCNGGAVWFKLSFPFSQRMPETADTMRCMYLNVMAEFLTED